MADESAGPPPHWQKSAPPPPPVLPPPPPPSEYQPPPPRPEEKLGKTGRRMPWTPLQPQDGLIGFGFVLLGLMVTGGIVLSLIDTEPARTLVSLVPQGIIFLGVPIAIAARRVGPRPWRAMGFVGFKPIDILWVILALVVQYAVSAAFVAFFFEPQQDTIIEGSEFNETSIAVIATVFLIVIAAPITEETLFRGLFFGALRSRTSFWPAALLSGVLFGAVHLASGDVAVAGLLSLLGVMLAALYERTGSLWPPILLHMINNTVAVAFLLSA